MTIHQHTFRAIGCTNSVLTTDATTIDEAARVTEAVVEELDLAASRFQAESEISRINGAASGERVDVVVSELLGGCITASLHAADTSRQPSPRPTSTST
jgi:thiamine biosynthesis lipoprotein